MAIYGYQHNAYILYIKIFVLKIYILMILEDKGN